MQFVHPEKVLQELPGASLIGPRCEAGLFGLETAEYIELVAGFAQRAGRAAARLLRDRAFGARVADLPFRPGDVVVALGDSITDDLQSWAEILRHLIDHTRPDDHIRVINAGVSGDTSASVVARFTQIARVNPQWIITLLGTNDARRHGTSQASMLVSHEESERNLAALRKLGREETRADLIWITPPPVLEDWIAASRLMSEEGLMWRNVDIAAKAELMRALDDPVVDIVPLFSSQRATELLLPDGLHPNIDGQEAIAGAVVRLLTGGVGCGQEDRTQSTSAGIAPGREDAAATGL